MFAGFPPFGAVLGRGLDLVLPPRCPVTGERVDRQGMLGSSAWVDIRFISEPFCSCCGYPFDFEAESSDRALCGVCVREAPPFNSARAALVYDEGSRTLILKFKHGDQTQMVRTFTPLLRRAGAAMLAEPGAVLVPVPLHPWRLWRRRYNQAALMARALAADTGVACAVDGLIRRRHTPSQGHRGFKDRYVNVKSAFTINPDRAGFLKERPAILIDDVMTSGATVRECAKVLKEAGVSAVHVLTLARVVRPEY